MKEIVIVGGVAGGMSFATRYRRLNPNDKITIFEKGPYVSFANCGLPYFISNEIEEKDDLLVVDQEYLSRQFDLEIHSSTEIIKIIPNNKQVIARNGTTETAYHYDKLVLALGAKPNVPNVLGVDKKHVFTLRNIPNAEQIKAYIDKYSPKTASIIGGGFIGLEMAENLSKLGLKVNVIELAPQILTVLDVEMASFVEQELHNHGVDTYVNVKINEINDHDILINDNVLIKSDLVILSTGVVPETTLAKDAGINLGLKGGIIVNSKLETSIRDIYAIGDAIITKNFVLKTDSLISLAGPANRQGRQLADIISGLSVDYKDTLATSIIRAFDLQVASTGINERQIKDINYGVVHLTFFNHATYFPNATPIYLKVIFNKDNEMILGAQGIGESGVDKRIDVIATAIKANMKVSDLQELDLAYAPPFGTAKDMINMVGYVAQNVLLGISKTIQWHEVEDLVKSGYILLDVRNDDERKESGEIKGSLHISWNTLKKDYNNLPVDKKIIVYCKSGIRAYNAERFLRSKGFDVYSLDGSFNFFAVANPKGVNHNV